MEEMKYFWGIGKIKGKVCNADESTLIIV